jgi:hypothetical protein
MGKLVAGGKGLMVLVGVLTLNACDRLCSSEEVTRLTSPDGAVDAVVLTRNCGAATAERTAVVLVRSGDELPATRVADSFRLRGTFPLELEWDGDTLTIVHGPGVPIEEGPTNRRGMSVRAVVGG